MPKTKDLVGQKFGRLTVVSRAQNYIQKNGRNRTMWNCVCDCGRSVIISGDNLKSGASKSCGCYRSETISRRRSTHHETDTLLYGVWSSMKTRCYNKNSDAYDRYGGRGIGVCDEWRYSFEAFRNWAFLNGYSEGLSIDRRDNDRGYSPDNCRWVGQAVQANNRSSNRLITANGETHNITEWSKIIGISPKTLFSRAYAGWSNEKILQH